MVRPSNIRFMARVLDAVVNLSNTKGSSTNEVLSFIRQSNVPHKNLTVQVQRALKHAVNAGLLRHRSGRYKILATLNPTPTPTVSKEPDGNNQKTEGKKSKPDVRAPIGHAESPRRRQERKKRSRRRSSRHRSSKARRKSRRSPYSRESTVPNRKRRQRKRTYEDEEYEDLPSGRYIMHGRNGESPVPFNRRTKRSRVSKRELESDFSDESDRESDVSRKRVSRAKKSTYRAPKRKETRAKSRGRSASPVRSPQRTMQAQQHPVEKIENERQERDDEDHGFVERDVGCQEAQEDVEGAREPNDSNSGSTLENSRD